MDRRTFIKLMAAMAASSLVSPAASFAETIEEGCIGRESQCGTGDRTRNGQTVFFQS